VCAREDGIRRSKDLRAEVGKFPNSTNERKKMSKKTIKQRIAIVAASALTAGFFSVVSSPAANAAADDFSIALVASTTGSAAANTTINSATSVGWIAATNSAGTASGTSSIAVDDQEAQTGVLTAGGQLSFLVESNTTTANGISIVVTGGTLSGITGANGTASVNGTLTTAVVAQNRRYCRYSDWRG